MALANLRAHQTKSTPSESEEDRTQHLLKRMNFEPLTPVSSFHPFRFTAFKTAEQSWLAVGHGSNTFLRQTAASDLPGVGGWEIWCEPAEPLGQSKYTKRIRVIRHPDSKGCKPYPAPPGDKDGKFLKFCELPQLPSQTTNRPPTLGSRYTRVFFLVVRNCASVCAPVLLCVEVQPPPLPDHSPSRLL